MNNVELAKPFSRMDQNARKKLLATNLASAYAAGDPGHHLKTYDRPGMSRGAGQFNQAGIDSAQAMADGIRDAYLQDDQLSLASAQSDLKQTTEQEAFANELSAMQQQDAYARQLAALTAQQNKMNFVTGILGGLLR